MAMNSQVLQPSSELTSNDLQEVLDAVYSISPDNVVNFGLKLGVTRDQISAFETQYNRNMKHCLREILNNRLKQLPPLTWREVVQALESRAVGEGALASSIQFQYTSLSLPVREPSDRGHYRSRLPVRGLSDRGHHRLRLPVREPSDRGHYRSRLPVRGLSDRGHYRLRLPVRGLSDRGHYRLRLPVRGLSDRGHYRLQPPVRGPSDREQPQYPPPPPLTHTSQYSSPQMSQFIDYVKTIYRSSEVERDTKVVKWPPTPSKVFINLACIDRASVRRGDYDEITKAMVHDGNVDVILKNKRSILLNEVAKDVPATNSTQKVILVEGAPGVGKSTFAWEFCRRWERGEIAQQYQLVLLLRLRDERMSRAKSLRDLIYHPLESVSEAVSLELIATHGFHALIILEGYDELPESCRSDHSIFPQLIAGKVLPLAIIMVTSRPWATGSIRYNHGHGVHQHIEILGFTNQQITQYIESTLPPDQVSDLSLYLERHPQIRMCMYIPLNSAIVVTVYQESQDGTVCAMPTTRTELYTALAHTLLLRYLRGHPEHESGTKPMKTFNDLPLVVHGKFSELCKLAYRGITGNSDHVQLIFNDSDLPSDFDSLGFMDSVTELYVTQGTVSSHNFLHLTFQEFFAAVHISTMSPSDQLEHFQRHKDGRYRVVLRFLAGLTKLTCFSKDTITNIFTDTGRTGSPFSVACDVNVTIDFINWMFEAHIDDVISSLLERKTVSITIESSMLPLDYYSLGYCIAHSKCQWLLSLNEYISEEEVRMLMAGASTRQETRGKVVGLRGVNPYKLSAEGLNMLFTQWKSLLHHYELHMELQATLDNIRWPDFSGLRVLNLRIMKLENWIPGTWGLDTLLPHLSLESLTISCTGNDGLVFEDCVAIGLHVKSTTCLKELCFTHSAGKIPVDDEVMEVISEALSNNQSLPLERLELMCHGTFTNTGADCLVQFITNTTTLQHLTIHYCRFSAHGLLALAQALHHSSTLQEKNLKELMFAVNGDNEANDFAKLLIEYPYMADSIDYQYFHNISDVGAAALAQALHHNSNLKRLNLSGNDAIGKEGTHQLIQSLASITKEDRGYLGGLTLPKRCEKYATQCTQYKSVKDKIRFL